MEASGVVGAMCWTGPDATGSRGPGGAGRCWVPAWWPMEGGLFLGFHFLRETENKREERGKMRKRGGGSKFIITNLASGRGPGAPRGVRLRPELGSPRSHSLSSTGSKGSDRGPVLQLGSCGLRRQARVHATPGRRAERGLCARARAPFIPAGEPSRPLPCPVCVARTSSTGHSLRVTRCRRRSTSSGRVLLRRRARSGRPSRTSSSPTRSGTLWTKPKVSERLPLRPARAREALEPRHGSHGADSHSGDAGKSKLPREPVEL